MLLSQPELVALTGYRRPRDQVAWVRDHYGINAYLNARGEAVVLRAHMEAAIRPPEAKAQVRQVRRVAA